MKLSCKQKTLHYNALSRMLSTGRCRGFTNSSFHLSRFPTITRTPFHSIRLFIKFFCMTANSNNASSPNAPGLDNIYVWFFYYVTLHQPGNSLSRYWPARCHKNVFSVINWNLRYFISFICPFVLFYILSCRILKSAKEKQLLLLCCS
jgi:hypothetical protein